MSYTTREFREKTKEVLDEVDKGEEVLITRGNKVYFIRRADKGQRLRPLNYDNVNQAKVFGEFLEYSCGCKKVEGKKLCKTHNRT